MIWDFEVIWKCARIFMPTVFGVGGLPHFRRWRGLGLEDLSGKIRSMTSTKSLIRSTTSADGLASCKFSKAKTIAERLGVCSRTIFRWAAEGKIARQKINARVVLFNEAEGMTLISVG